MPCTEIGPQQATVQPSLRHHNTLLIGKLLVIFKQTLAFGKACPWAITQRVEYTSVLFSVVTQTLSLPVLSPRKLHPLLEEPDAKNGSWKNYSFWTFAARMNQTPQKK